MTLKEQLHNSPAHLKGRPDPSCPVCNPALLRKRPALTLPQSYQPSRTREEYRITFSELKKLINDVDEKAWGDCYVYVGDNEKCPMVDLSFSSGLPASLAGSSAARWYGVHEAIPPKVSIQFMTPEQLEALAKK